MNTIIGILNINGLYISIEDFEKKYGKAGIRKIKNKYTITYHNFVTKINSSLTGWKTTKKYLILPRFSAYKLLDKGIIDKIDNQITILKSININYIGTPTKNQNIVAKYLMNNIYNDKTQKGCILKQITGSGKTFTSFEIIKKINKKTLIIVPNSYLLNQWVTLLEQYFPDNIIGQYYTNKKKDGDIIVSIIKSAAQSSEFMFKKGRGLYDIIKSDEFFKQFGLIVYDECHMYCTPTYKQIFHKANVENVLGLSATPDERIDGFDKLIKFHLGEIIDAEEIEKYEKQNTTFEANIKILRYNAPDEYTNVHINQYNQLVCVPKIIEELISDPYRNQLIINQILELYNQHLNIFIFSDRREHLEILYNQFVNVLNKDEKNNVFIPELYKNDDKRLEKLEKSTILYGGCKDPEINHAKNKSKVIFTTYQYSSTGVSIVKMNALILATPRRNNMTQIIGRIFRLGSDMTITRIIIDLLDNKSVLKGQLSARKKAYNLRDCGYEEEIIDYTEIEI